MRRLRVIKLVSCLLLSFQAFSQVTVNIYQETDTFKRGSYIDSSYIIKQLNIRINQDSFKVGNELVRSVSDIKKFYPNGVLKEEYSRYNLFLEGTYKSYYANGQLKELFFNSHGNRVGLYVSFYRSGAKKEFGTYVLISDTPDFDMIKDTIVRYDPMRGDSVRLITADISPINFKDNVWYYWDEKGNLVSIEYWNKGKLVKKEE